jgi:Cd2+/Zn2+-exporting ATPase
MQDGHGPSKLAGQLSFRIRGMDCAEEAEALRQAVGPLVGGAERLGFDVLNGKMFVTASPDGVTPDAICAAVARTGMSAEPWATAARGHTDDPRLRRVRAITTLASGMLVLVGVLLHRWQADSWREVFAEGAGRSPPWPALGAYAAAIVLGGRMVVMKAWYAARRLRPDMNLLMTVAVAGAVIIGDWLEAATVAFLFAVSLALEGWSVGRARKAIAALLDLAPPEARVVGPEGIEQTVLAADVAVGATLVIRPGERIPLDGRVVAGSSGVDQATITGESLPVPKGPGADVFAGTINGEGVLRIETTRRAEDTTLARIIQMVEAAQSRRSQAEQWVERFARIYTPAVMALALAAAVLPPLVLGGGWGSWFYRALVMLVIACPCALVISTPVSIVAGVAAAARAGVLVKGGAFLELPGRLRAVAFDKTGTLTLGEPRVLGIYPVNDHTEVQLLERAAALEAHSTHPLARAISEYARARGVVPAPAEDVQMRPGQGITGRFDGRSFWLGSHRYLEARAQETPALHQMAEEIQRQGRTVVVIGSEAYVCGLIAIADAVRPAAGPALRALRNAGVEALVMLTGDNRATAESVAAEVGITELRAELLPAEKVAVVEDLKSRYGAVGMVGDGVNDAPAMATASVAIAMGAAGSDAAIETADIALMSDDLSKLPWLIHHSRRTLAVIRQNIALSLVVKLAVLLLTFAGLASLWVAIAADMGASLLVVANGLRLLRSGATRGPAILRGANATG